MEEQLYNGSNDVSITGVLVPPLTGQLVKVISEFPFFSTTAAFTFVIKLA